MSYEGRLRRSEWTVRPVSLAVAQDMVERLHYSAGGANTATYAHGLFCADRLRFLGEWRGGYHQRKRRR